MEFKGTKGEWKIVRGAMATCIESGNKDICTLTSGLSEVNKYNARLIEAAPKLLKALQLLMKEYDSKGQLLGFDIDIARQAINKALK